MAYIQGACFVGGVWTKLVFRFFLLTHHTQTSFLFTSSCTTVLVLVLYFTDTKIILSFLSHHPFSSIHFINQHQYLCIGQFNPFTSNSTSLALSACGCMLIQPTKAIFNRSDNLQTENNISNDFADGIRENDYIGTIKGIHFSIAIGGVNCWKIFR